MGRHHLARVGSLGRVGRFAAVDQTCYPRHARVVLRTARGLELGEVLTSPDDEPDDAPADGSILRGVTVEDELIEVRLERNREAAFAACTARLKDLNLPTTLMDVEHLFDGQSLFFYFLGETTPAIDALTVEFAELYDAQVQFRKFTEAMTEGCGPGCGTDEATGGGCTSCSVGCAVAGACAPRRG